MTPADKRRYLEEFAQIFAPARPPAGWDKLLDEDTDDAASPQLPLEFPPIISEILSLSKSHKSA